MTSSSESLWKQHNYEVRRTEDGSPSLQWLGEGHDETMHHSGGAWTETWYIYGEALKAGIEQGGARVLSVGLGLGYNEFLSTRLSLEAKAPIEIHSHEKDPFLVQEFLGFIENQVSSPSEILAIYSSLLSFVAPPVEKSQILTSLAHKKITGEFQIRGPLAWESFKQAEKYSMILYDAFSSKASPELWQEDFLNKFIEVYSEEKCIFTTYACTGALKRALKKNDFKVIERRGFQGKKSSTIATRGFILEPGLIRGIS